VVAARREGLHRIMVGIAAEVLSDIEPAVVSALNRAIGDR